LQVAPANAQPKPAKELAYPTHRQKTMQQKTDITTDEKEHRTANSTYPKGGVSCSKDSFVVNRTLVFQIKFCGKSPALRVAAKRYTSN
jgi:hypothetical protein